MRTACGSPEWVACARCQPHLQALAAAGMGARAGRGGECGTCRGAHRRRGRGAGKSAGQRAPQVVLGIAVTAGKLRTGELQNGAHLRGGCALGEQFPRHPKIYNTPVRLRKALGNAPAPHPVLVDLYGFGWANGDGSRRGVGIPGTVRVDGYGGARLRRRRRGRTCCGRLRKTGVPSKRRRSPSITSPRTWRTGRLGCWGRRHAGNAC